MPVLCLLDLISLHVDLETRGLLDHVHRVPRATVFIYLSQLSAENTSSYLLPAEREDHVCWDLGGGRMPNFHRGVWDCRTIRLSTSGYIGIIGPS